MDEAGVGGPPGSSSSSFFGSDPTGGYGGAAGEDGGRTATPPPGLGGIAMLNAEQDSVVTPSERTKVPRSPAPTLLCALLFTSSLINCSPPLALSSFPSHRIGLRRSGDCGFSRAGVVVPLHNASLSIRHAQPLSRCPTRTHAHSFLSRSLAGVC
jgi:hypothetical protein